MHNIPMHDNRFIADKSVSNFTFILYLTYFVSFFIHLSARISGIDKFRPDMVLAIAIISMLVLQIDKLKHRFDNPIQRILLLLLVYIILSIPFVEWPGSVLRENLVTLIKAVVFFYFTILIIDTDKRLKLMIMTFIFCQLFRVLEPLYLHEVYGYWGSATHIGGGHLADRLSGAPNDIINPNGLAFVIAMLFPFLYYIFANSNWLFRIIFYLLIPLLLYVLLLTLSRSGFIALAVIIWNIIIRSKHKFLMILVIFFTAIFIWANMSDIQQDRYLSLTGDKNTAAAATFYGRLSGFTESFDVIGDAPVFGHGVGTSKEATVTQYGKGHISHILYAEIAIEMGIIGFIIYMIFIKRIFNLLKHARINISKLREREIANKPNADDSLNINYYNNLILSLSSCFWMYLIFSFAQYGVSEYHWYLLAGLTALVCRNINSRTEYNKSLSG